MHHSYLRSYASPPRSALLIFRADLFSGAVIPEHAVIEPQYLGAELPDCFHGVGNDDDGRSLFDDLFNALLAFLLEAVVAY